MTRGQEQGAAATGTVAAPDPARFGPIRAGLAQALEVAAKADLIGPADGVLVAIAGRYADLADQALDLDTFEAAEGRLRAVLQLLAADADAPSAAAGGDDDRDDDGAAPDERARILELIRRGPTVGDASHA